MVLDDRRGAAEPVIETEDSAAHSTSKRTVVSSVIQRQRLYDTKANYPVQTV
jgi:hypothetical protein